MHRSRFCSARHNLPAPCVLRLLCSRHTSGTVRLPALLTHVLPYAGRSDYAIATLLTGQRLPSEPQRARSASRARCLRVVSLCMCARGSDRLALVTRAVRGVMLRSWARVMRPRRPHLVVCGVAYAVAVLASEVARRAIAHSSVRRPDGCR